MPGVRAGIVWDLPRSRLAVAKQWGLAAELRARGYGTALVLPRTWKAAIAPALAGIPERVGFFGEARFGLINRMRWGEKALPRFIDKNAALALPAGAPLPPEWPVPQLVVPREEIARWRQANDLGTGPAVALAPGLRRRLQALDLLPRRRAAAGRARARRLGGRRPRREGAGAGDRRRRPRQGPRPHRVTTCATASWRWRRPASPSRTIPA